MLLTTPKNVSRGHQVPSAALFRAWNVPARCTLLHDARYGARTRWTSEVEQPMTKGERKLPRAGDRRPTEDELARAKLGGPRGSPDLRPAPLTPQEREQILPNDDPGHTA
jgi:hypothetical protein